MKLINKNAAQLKRSVLAATLVIGQAFSMPLLPAFASSHDVLLGGETIFANIAAVGGMSGEQRAEKVQNNLDNALVASKDLTPGSVAVSYVKGSPVLTLGGYQVVTVDSASAKAAGTTPALLAKRWADSLRNALTEQANVEAYVGQISGSYQSSAPAVIPSAPTPTGTSVAPSSPVPQQGNYTQMPPTMQGRIVYAPQGLVIPATLSTAVASDIAKPGDLVQAQTSQAVILGDTQLPAGTVLLGQISESAAGRMLGRSGALEIKFNRLRTMDGQEIPLTAHIMGGIDKYNDNGNDRQDKFYGETWKGKAVQAGVRGLIGAGTGAALGTAVGAIAGGGRGVGKGAWSGTAIGAGVGVAQSLLLRKGQNVRIASGTPLQLQLDAPLQFAAPAMQPPVAYTGNY